VNEATGEHEEFTYKDAAGAPIMVAKYDPSLEDWVERHLHPEIPDEIHGQPTKKHDVWATDQATWNATDVVATAQRELQQMMGAFYGERDELKDEAMKCFNEHHRPTDSCIDVFSDDKLIGNHESNKHMPKNDRMYLCHLCPFVHGYVIPEVRSRKIRRVSRRR
jgi:hypothetical protein